VRHVVERDIDAHIGIPTQKLNEPVRHDATPCNAFASTQPRILRPFRSD
jgi:hypothetical protein